MPEINKEKRQPNSFEVFFPLVFMMGALIIGRVFMNVEMSLLLLISTAVTVILGFKLGRTWDELLDGIVNRTVNSISAIFLLLIVGAMIGAMIVSGTVPMLIYYGIKLINPQWLIAASFLLCSLVSLVTGTSWGAVATIGVAVMGVGMALDVNLAAVAGAVVGGSWFGDKLSPLSDTTNLTAASTGTELFDHVRQMLWTSVPAAVIAMVVYIFIGLTSPIQHDVSSELLTGMIQQLDTLYNWNILLLLPIVVVLIASIKKLPSIPVMVAASFIAGLEAVFFQGITTNDMFDALYGGFQMGMVNHSQLEIIPEIAQLLERGGMFSMMGTVLLILCALAYAGALDGAGCLEGMLARFSKIITSRRSLLLTTIFSCLGICCITNNYVSSVVLGEMYQDLYRKKGLHTANLSRILEDCGTCIIPLVPWSASGAYVIMMLDITPLALIPWAIFCWMNPIISLFYAVTGIGIRECESSLIQ